MDRVTCLNTILFLSLALSVLILGCGESDPDSPIIFSVESDPEMISPGKLATITVEAGDSDSAELFYTWTVSSGTIQGDGKTITWLPPDTEGKYELIVTVSDGSNVVSETVILRVSRNYYPLAVGNIWTYEDSEGATINFEIVDTVDIEALDVTTFVKQMTISDLEDAANFTYIAKNSDGISQYGMGGSNAGGDTITFSPELPIYRFPPILNESWTVDFDVKLEFGFFVGTGTATYEVVSEGELTVEAGTFQHVFQIKEDFIWELAGDQIDHIITRHWLAPDVGIIKFSQEETIGEQTIITEATLQSYTVE